MGIHIDFDYVQQNFLGRSFSHVVDNINDNFNVILAEDIEQKYRLKLLESFKTELLPISGITEILSDLSVKFCLASSSSPERIKNSLEYTALAKWFPDGVFSAVEVENGKPAPDLFLLAAKTMGYAPEECLVIEDSLSGIQAALSAGMEVIHFVGGSHYSDIKTGVLVDKAPEVPVINKWSEFFIKRPEFKKSIIFRNEVGNG